MAGAHGSERRERTKTNLTSHASHPALARCRALLIPGLSLSPAIPYPPWLSRSGSGPRPATPPLLHLSSSPPPRTAQRIDPSSPAPAGAMGQRRFRLADMMPNSWFYKLRDMRRARGHPTPGAAGAMLPSPSPSPRAARPAARAASSPRRSGSVALPHRTSYYYPTRDREAPASPPRATVTEEDRELLPQPESPPPPPPPTCSSRRRHRVGPVTAVRVVRRGLEAVADADALDAPRRRRDMYVGRDGSGDEDVGYVLGRPAVTSPSEDTLGGKMIATETDIVIDLRAEGTAERVLRPIVTRPARREVARYEPKDRHVDGAEATPRASSASEQGSRAHHPRRSSVSAGRRLRTRVNSPRLAASARSRKSKPATPASSPRKTTPPPPPLAESFAVVKASADPRRDFRESMEEMIAEKGIRGAADLEDLLACYLTLNAAEHHDLIVEVFEQIWASLAGATSP